MSTTDEMTPAERRKQVRARLDEIGPYPADPGATTAAGLARRLSVRAAVISHQQLGPDAPFSAGQIDRLTVLFAAAHALYALDAYAGADSADAVAAGRLSPLTETWLTRSRSAPFTISTVATARTVIGVPTPGIGSDALAAN